LYSALICSAAAPLSVVTASPSTTLLACAPARSCGAHAAELGSGHAMGDYI